MRADSGADRGAGLRAGLGAGAPLLPILLVPDRTLKARARTVHPEDMDEVRALLPSLFATMYAAPGIGLAAPQVGLGLRLAVVDLMPDDQPAPIVLVNPQVVGSSDEQATREEGCLSLPGMYADVTRPARVRVRYQDVEGRTRELEADGLLAACLQHELDHLDGVLFVDHLSATQAQHDPASPGQGAEAEGRRVMPEAPGPQERQGPAPDRVPASPHPTRIASPAASPAGDSRECGSGGATPSGSPPPRHGAEPWPPLPTAAQGQGSVA